MKHAIRALGWATIVLWILVIIFSGTAVYSAMQVGIEQGEPQVTLSNGVAITSVPFIINNKGFYDITNFGITTSITDKSGTSISNSTTPATSIPKNSNVTRTHNISVVLRDILARNLTYMLTNDTVLDVDMSVSLTYAHAIPLRISFNTTMPWGAPIYDLTVSGISIVSPNQVNVSLGFENHAFFGLDGTMRLEIVDESDNKIGSRTVDISVPPESIYDETIPVTITNDPEDMAEVHVHFDTSLFSFGPVVIPLG